MHSMETKIFNLDGQKLRFDARTFEYSFRAYAQDSKMKKKDLEELLAEKAALEKDLNPLMLNILMKRCLHHSTRIFCWIRSNICRWTMFF